MMCFHAFAHFSAHFGHTVWWTRSYTNWNHERECDGPMHTEKRWNVLCAYQKRNLCTRRVIHFITFTVLNRVFRCKEIKNISAAWIHMEMLAHFCFSTQTTPTEIELIEVCVQLYHEQSVGGMEEGGECISVDIILYFAFDRRINFYASITNAIFGNELCDLCRHCGRPKA